MLNDVSVRFNCRILRTSVNLKKLDVRGLKRISPEGIQVNFVNVFNYNIKLKGSFVREDVFWENIFTTPLRKLT